MGERVTAQLQLDGEASAAPSAILRADPAEREDATTMLVDDLRSARKRLG